MAKWGEGDPRWIVEERADAKNVNNWHWSEKNATQWSKDCIKGLFKNLSLGERVFITQVAACEGEALVNNRKAKLIFFYEWDIKLKWEGSLCSESDNKTVYKGTIHIPNLSEEYEAHEIDIEVTLDENQNSNDAWKVKEFVRLEGKKEIQQKLAKYIAALKSEYGSNLILPSSTAPTNTNSNQATTAATVSKATIKTSIGTASGKDNGSTRLIDINFHYDLICGPSDLYRVLTNRDMLAAFSCSSVTAETREGGPFSLYNGLIHGTFVRLDETNHSVEMAWRLKSWKPESLMSRVTVNCEATTTGTSAKVSVKGVPEGERDATEKGWREYYFVPIQRTFGFGGQIY